MHTEHAEHDLSRESGPFSHQKTLLEAPQCTNLTYNNTFRDKMLLFINDTEIRDILCNLSEAASYLNCIHVSTII